MAQQRFERRPTPRNFCPHRTEKTIFLKMKIFGKNTLKKNDRIE